jgi:hypothetical protein
MMNNNKTNPPISKECTTCKKILLLSEFEIDESAKDKRADSCKSCQHKNEPYGTCCREHFQNMLISNTYTQLEILLDQVNVFRLNGVEIPRELLKKMFDITHFANVRCSYDSCSKIGEQIQP